MKLVLCPQLWCPLSCAWFLLCWPGNSGAAAHGGGAKRQAGKGWVTPEGDSGKLKAIFPRANSSDLDNDLG